MRRDRITNTYTGYNAEKLAENFARAYVKNGVVYWSSNDRTPFEDMLTDFMEAGFITKENVELSLAAKQRQDAEAIAEYIKSQKRRTPEQIAEERFEARAAFGAGATVVNVFTGETYTV